MKTRPFLVAVAATASLAGCGAEDTPTSSSGAKPSQETANKKAMLEFASCMRENGVDMPDPQFEGGRVSQKLGKTNPDTMRKAEAACAKYRDKVKAPDISDSQKAEFKKAALANARCMREHGIDFPDPQFDTNGGARIRLGKNLNPDSPKFQAAQKACESTLPMGGPSTTDAGGGEK